MKAYKFERSSYSYHWSASWAEKYFYVFELNKLLYISHQQGKETLGISNNQELIKLVKKYCDECLSGVIPKYENALQESISTNPFELSNYRSKNPDKVIVENLYSFNKYGSPYLLNSPSSLKLKTYCKKTKEGFDVNYWGFEEVDLEITDDIMKEFQENCDYIEELEGKLKQAKENSNTFMKTFLK